MDGCGSCMKYSLFIANLLIFIGSLVLIGFGIYMLVDKSFASNLMGNNYQGAVYVVIGASILVALISCFGCFGAAQEVRCMLLTYFIIVCLIFITLLVGGILLYVFRHQVETQARKELDNLLHQYNTTSEAKETWDELQTGFNCCGNTDYHDWRGAIPASCCKPPVAGKPHTSCSVAQVATTPGCFTVWTEGLKKNAAILGGIGIAVACVMLLALVFSCSLFCMID